MPARYMPVAIRDETGAFIRQMAQGNQALAQLYTRLLAQYEERLANQEFQREMHGMREAAADRRSAESDARWYDRTNYTHGLRNPQAPQGPNYLGPGAAGVPNPMAPTTTPPAGPAAAQPQAPARPSVYTIDNNPFSQGAGASTPATPAPQASAAGSNAFAMAGDQEFSAQSRKPLPTVEQPPRPPKREPAPATQLPSQPRAPTARTAATRPQAGYLAIDQRWLDLMHQKEDEFGLPRGVMMTTYGIENGGGRQFGKNKSGSAEGIYQFHKDLRAVYKLSDQDLYDPAKMIHFAAYNMRRNADILKANYKIDLPNTPETIPLWVGLHQWGEKGGPRLVAAYLQNPKAPMVGQIGTHKDAQGNVIPNHTVLSINGVDPTWTVEQALQNKALPWYRTYSQEFPNHAVQPQGKYTSTPAPQLQTPQQPQVGDPNAPRPPGSIPQQHGTMGSNPRLVAAVRGGASLALPEGYTLRQTSGHRHGDSGYHGRRAAADFQIFTPDGRPIPNRGEDTTGLYTRLARGVKSWVRENDPQLERIIGYGGAFGTRKGGGGGVPDLMHYDLGGSRGRMRPEVQFARLQPLSTEERNTQVAQQQPQQPVKVAGPIPTKEAPQPPTPPERQVMPAISRIPTSPEVAATFDKKIAGMGFDQRTADAAATLLTPVKPQASGVAARSDLDYNKPPDPITPQASTLAARSDLDYGAAPPPKEPIKWGDELTPGIAGVSPPTDVEVTPPERGAAPVELSNEQFKVATPPVDPTAMPPRLDAGTVPKEPLPSEFTSADPRQATPDPLVPETATPREPLPPDFKVPWPPLDGGASSAIANAPSGQMPRDMQLPQQLPPPLPPEQVPQGANAPTMRGILDVIRSGNIPNLSTAAPAGPEPQQPITPIQLKQIQQAIYGAYGSTPRGMRERAEGKLPVAEGPAAPDERQEQFNQAMREYVQEKIGGTPLDVARQGIHALGTAAHDATPKVIDWIIQKAREYSQSSPSPPPKQHPTAQVPQSAPVRTMPDGRPYIPQGEPLNVPPPPGGPTNTTLSPSGPVQGNTPLPPPPGGAGKLPINPLTGRPDVPQPIVQPDGTVLYPEPGE